MMFRVNSIAPGMVYTPMVRAQGMTPEIRKARQDRSLLGTEGTAWDVGYAAVYLASHEARWVTGIVLPVDAGATAGTTSRPALGDETASGRNPYNLFKAEGETSDPVEATRS